MSYSPTAPVVSTLNSTSTALGISETYTGTWERAPRSMVLVQTFADEAGTLHFDFSTDGVNADDTSSYAATASTVLVKLAVVSGRYARIRYVNGGVAQTIFRLETSFSELNEITGLSDAIVNMNAAVALSDSALMTRNADFMLDVPRGLYTSMTGVNKYGRNNDCDLDTQTDIWDGATGASPTWVAPTAARVHAVVSTDGNDVDGGTGANEVRVYGLTDWDTAETSELITLGASPVNTVNSYVIIHRMRVTDFGSAGPNAGTITATAASPDSTVTAQINVGEGQTQMAIYGIPSTQTAYMPGYYQSVNRAVSTTCNATLLFNPIPNTEETAFIVKHTRGINSAGSTGFHHKFTPYRKFSGPGILKVAATASANNCDVDAGFDLILVTE